MIKFENTEVIGWEHAIRGMRNPMNSWDKSDSNYCNGRSKFCDTCCVRPKDEEAPCYTATENKGKLFVVGENDLNLMKRLRDAGTDHRKFMRMIVVYVDITAPLYWWKEFDTYKVGTVANSCSTMHRLAYNPFKMSDFSFEHLIGNESKEYFNVEYDFKEVFRDIPEHKNYSISNKGRVWSKKRDKFLIPSVNSSNYKKVVLNGKNCYVHRLVAQTFCPNPNELKEVNHIDGNKWNNNYVNLEWVSKSENAKHAFDLGLRTVSGYTRYKVAHSAHRFTSDEIEEIKQLYYDGMSKQEIANKFNCYSSTICNIINGKTYREIEMTPYDTAKLLVDYLNELRDIYLEFKNKDIWYQMIQLLPSSYNQKRTVMLNYEVLANIYKSRKDHKLDEWRVGFMDWIESLPYSDILIF